MKQRVPLAYGLPSSRDISTPSGGFSSVPWTPETCAVAQAALFKEVDTADLLHNKRQVLEEAKILNSRADWRDATQSIFVTTKERKGYGR